MDKKFSLKLFFSADLIGSTALKSNAEGVTLEPPWLETFQGFYSEFPVIFKNEQDKLGCKPIDFWKGIGDELLWVTTLTKGDDALSSLRPFKLSLEEYNRRLDTTGKKVRLKGTAWIAGFPITHREVPLPNTEKKEVDYIDPYIDTGFRLSKFASQMKMVVSVDLAWLILNCRVKSSEENNLVLRFDESESMKGVLNSKPYPIIWIKCDSPLEELEYDLHHRENHNANWRTSLEKFCEAFITATDDKIIFPYIIDDDVFGKSPHKSYEEWCKKNQEPAEMNDEEQFVDSKYELAGNLNENIKFVKAEW